MVFSAVELLVKLAYDLQVDHRAAVVSTPAGSGLCYLLVFLQSSKLPDDRVYPSSTVTSNNTKSLWIYYGQYFKEVSQQLGALEAADCRAAQSSGQPSDRFRSARDLTLGPRNEIMGIREQSLGLCRRMSVEQH